MKSALALAMSLAAGAAAAGQAAGVAPTYGARDGGPSLLLSNADGQSPYASIVRYEGRTQCTGVFLATRPSDEHSGSAPAYVISNGHCSDFPGANDVLPDRPSPAGRRVLFNYFADTPGQQVPIAVSRIAYATMKGRDVAVLELAARYDDLIRRGFHPWSVTAEPPVRTEPVVIVGAPLVTPSPSFLRLAVCRIEIMAPVVLEYVWHWFDVHGNRCADIRPGSSGSPVISRLTGRVLGLLNTTTIGAIRYSECFLNHPCEPTLRGEVSQTNTSYMTPVAGIDRCFDEDGRFNVLQPDCPLDPGIQMRAAPAFLGAANPRLDTLPIGQPRRRWNVTVSGPFPLYRHKVVSAAIGDCHDLRGYAAPRRVIDRPLIDDLLPTLDGHYFLCVIGGMEARRSDGWQSVDHPAIVSVRIDSTPPDIPARIDIEESDLGWRVTFETLASEISFHTLKFGRPGETRCEDPVDYRLALIPFYFLPKANRPYLFCAIPYDSAGNPGRVFEALLP